MVITYHGDNFFRIQNGSFTLLVDPSNERMKPDLVLKTISPPQFDPQSVTDNLIDTAGEFDISGVSIKGVQVQKESTDKFIKSAFSIELEDLKLCFLGHLSENLDAKEVEKLGKNNLLFIPVGSPPFLSTSDTAKIIKQLEPSIVIPSFHGKNSQKEFFDEIGQEGELSEKLVLKAKDLPDKGFKVVVLKKA